MNKKTYIKIRSTCVPLAMENVDTDQIIPARFLKTTTREGFGENLFRDWRYDGEGKQKIGFVLNDPLYSGTILVAGTNFVCGSSRENAAWAIKDYGFNAVISSFFADIFKNNALNNKLLPVQVSEKFLDVLFNVIEKNPKTSVIIDIQKQIVTIPNLKMSERFYINEYKKLCFIKGYDDIDYLMSMKKNIEAFEKKRQSDFYHS